MGSSTISVSRVTLTSEHGGTCINPSVASIPGITLDGSGFGCTLNISSSSGGTFTLNTIANGGTGYSVGDILRISTSVLGVGGNASNDFTANVNTINPFTGSVFSINAISGTSISTISSTIYPTTTGNGANLTVDTNGGQYSARILYGGTDFVTGNKLTVPGNLLGGLTPENDMTCDVGLAGSGSTIISVGPVTDNNYTFKFTDVATSGATQGGPSNLSGSGLTLDITYNIQADTYSAVIKNPGSANYGGDGTQNIDSVTVDGFAIGGISSTNDLNVSLTVSNSVPTAGNILAITSITGNSPNPMSLTASGRTANVGTATIGIDCTWVPGSPGHTLFFPPSTPTYQTGNTWTISDFLSILPASVKFISNSPLLFPITTVSTSIGTGISLLKNFSSNALNNYSQIKFDLPSSVFKNVVYMDWVNSFGLQMPAFLNIDEFKQSSVTTKNLPYWRFVTPNTMNNVPDHISVKFLTPDNYNKFTVKLMGSDGQLINQPAHWGIELIVYSQV